MLSQSKAPSGGSWSGKDWGGLFHEDRKGGKENNGTELGALEDSNRGLKALERIRVYPAQG